MGRAASGPRRGLTAPAVDGPRVRQNAEGLPGPPGELGRRLRRAGMGRGTSGSPRGGGEGGLRRRWTKERKDGKGEPEAALDAGSRPGHPRGPCADPCLQRHGRVTPCGRSPAPSGSPPGCGHHSLSVRVTRASGSPPASVRVTFGPRPRLHFPSGSPVRPGHPGVSVRVTPGPGLGTVPRRGPPGAGALLPRPRGQSICTAVWCVHAQRKPSGPVVGSRVFCALARRLRFDRGTPLTRRRSAPGAVALGLQPLYPVSAPACSLKRSASRLRKWSDTESLLHRRGGKAHTMTCGPLSATRRPCTVPRGPLHGVTAPSHARRASSGPISPLSAVSTHLVLRRHPDPSPAVPLDRSPRPRGRWPPAPLAYWRHQGTARPCARAPGEPRRRPW